MNLTPLLSQPGYPKRQNRGISRQLSNPVVTMSYDSTMSVQAIPRIPRVSSSSTERVSSFSYHAGHVPRHLRPQNIARAPTVSSSSATVPHISIRPSEWQSSSTVIANDVQGCVWPLPSGNQAVLPLHTRSLYATIPLPRVDIYGQRDAHRGETITTGAKSRRRSSSLSGLASTQPPKPNLHRHPQTWTGQPSYPRDARAIQLHPMLHSTHLSSCWACDCHEPATKPGIGHLTLFIHSTGETIDVYPSSPNNSYVVTVDDIRNALKCVFNIADRPCGEHYPTSRHTKSCKCERISAIVNSLELWWWVDEDALSGRRPWQLVVEQR